MAAFIRKSPGRFFLVLFLLTFSFYCVLSATSSSQTEGRPPLIADEGESRVWSVSLQTGENYFSLPLIPFGVTWQELFGRKFSSLEEIACYNPFVAGDEAWQRFYPDRPTISVEDKPVSLVFRVIANEPVTLWFEGQRFTEDIDKHVSLESRLKVGPGWNFLGGAFDSDLTRDSFENILNDQNFAVDRDYLYLWNGSGQNWTRLRSSSAYSSIKPGAVLMASFECNAGQDPYNSGSDRSSEGDNAGASMSHLSYVSDNSSDIKEYSEAGDDFEAGQFKVTDYTYEKDTDGNITKGSGWITLPEAFRGFTDLSQKVRAEIDYTDIGDEILKINILGISEIAVGVGTSTERQLSDIEDLFITADGIFYGEGKLLSEAVTDGTTDELDLEVRLIWNNEWPSIDPDEAIGVDDPDELKKTEHPVMEIEFEISERTMAALRWWKKGTDVKAIDGWKLYFHSGLEGYFQLAQNIPDDEGIGIQSSVAVELSSHDGETDSSKPVPHFIGRDLVKAHSFRSYVFKGLVSEDDPADIYAYGTGLITIKLSEDWNCNIYDESVDFEVKASDHFSFHLLYTLDAEGCEVNSREEGADSGLSASLSPAIVFDGHDFDIGDLHIKKMIASLEGRGELKYAIGRGSNGIMGIKRLLAKLPFLNLFKSTEKTNWKEILGVKGDGRGWEAFSESSLGIGLSGLVEISVRKGF